MKNLRIYTSFLLLLLTVVVAQPAAFRVQAPAQVVEGQKFSVTFLLENAAGSPSGKPEVGQLANCKQLFGPAVSQSSSYSNINGRESMSSSIGYTYTYRADKAGKVNIPPAKIVVGGKTFTTTAKSLEILPPDRSASNNSGQSVQAYDVDSHTTDKPIGSNELFIRMHLSKPKVCEQEGVVCTMKLYSKYNVRKLANNVQPSYNGFISEEVPLQLQGRMEEYNGSIYYVYEIKRVILFPQRSGKLEITSGSYDVTVLQYQTINVPPFGRMRDVVERTLKVESNKLSLDVTDFPESRPDDFTGAVGNFKVEAKLVGNKVRTNEAATIRLTISGNGNMKSLTPPSFSFPSQFDVYDPQTTVKATPSGDGLSGKVEVDYTFVPQSVGKFSVDGISFSYFNPVTQKYHTLAINGFDFQVEQGTSSGTVKYNKDPMKDIRPLYRGELDVEKSTEGYFGALWYLLYYVVLSFAFAAILVLYRKRLKDRANVKMMKRKGANRVAVRRLRRAKRHKQKGEKEKFYEEMLTALWGYFSDKLSIPVSELNRDNISRELDAFGLDADSIAEIIRIIDDCEFSRYAQYAGESVSMDEVYSDASRMIGVVENTKKRQK